MAAGSQLSDPSASESSTFQSTGSSTTVAPGGDSTNSHSHNPRCVQARTGSSPKANWSQSSMVLLCPCHHGV